MPAFLLYIVPLCSPSSVPWLFNFYSPIRYNPLVFEEAAKVSACWLFLSRNDFMWNSKIIGIKKILSLPLVLKKRARLNFSPLQGNLHFFQSLNDAKLKLSLFITPLYAQQLRRTVVNSESNIWSTRTSSIASAVVSYILLCRNHWQICCGLWWHWAASKGLIV